MNFSKKGILKVLSRDDGMEQISRHGHVFENIQWEPELFMNGGTVGELKRGRPLCKNLTSFSLGLANAVPFLRVFRKQILNLSFNYRASLETLVATGKYFRNIRKLELAGEVTCETVNESGLWKRMERF